MRKMAFYILEELPEVISRVKIGGVVCDAYAYPFDGDLPEFVEQLQQKKIFPKIAGKLLDTQSKVFLEVR